MSTYHRNLSEGPIYSTLIRFSAPLILSSFLQSLYNIVDMLVAGKYCGEVGLSAVTNGGAVMTLITFVAMGLSTGANVIIGQHYGAKEDSERRSASSTAFSFMMLLGACFAVGLLLAAKPILTVMDVPAPKETLTYFRICAVGSIFIYGYNGLSAIIRAVGDSRTPLIIIIVAAAVNIGLDFLCVAAFDMGVAGTAVATVASQFISFLLALLYIQRKRNYFGMTFRIDPADLRGILRVGTPCALLFCVNGLTHLLVTSMINGYGTTISAGSGIGSKIMDIFSSFITAMMNATATVVAQCIGAEKYDRVKQVHRASLTLMLIVAGLGMIVIGFLAPILACVFVTEKDVAVIAAASYYLRSELLLLPFFALFTSYQGVATGAGDTRFAMLNAIFAMALPRLLLTVILHKLIGLQGIYFGVAFAPLFAVPLGAMYFHKERWHHKLNRG